ncbi:MAG: c-type cytochrome [Gemmatimonadota bacterium]|nr:c-type cytochrome [Gemmatimonadota bacterium]
MRRRDLRLGVVLVTAIVFTAVTGTDARAQSATEDHDARRATYRSACAACHGAGGTGVEASRVAFEEPLPDFTECTFASREPDADWVAVAHDGGPARGFSEMMPAFGDALTAEELQWAVDHVRTFCADDDWPRGELNLPRPIVTEKAYPEDEAVWTTSAAVEGDGALMHEIVYEKRFGARNQIEVVVPFGWHEMEVEGGLDWRGGVGDVAVGLKRALFHSLSSGSIFSATAEIVLPTGDEADGFGKGTTVFEPFLSFGQLLPWDSFLHLQAGAELPFDTEVAHEEAFWRAALGKSFAAGRLGFGRTWSPMIEILGARELTAGEDVVWDLLPQVQVTLNTRQHVMANVGVRIPVDPDTGDAELLVYLLWDWFDGGLTEGW